LNDRAVKHVSIPHLWDLSRSKQAPFDPGRDEVMHEAFSDICRFTEDHLDSVNDSVFLAAEFGIRWISVRNRILGQGYSPALITTLRRRSSPSDSEYSPSSSTTSCTIMRSYWLTGLLP